MVLKSALSLKLSPSVIGVLSLGALAFFIALEVQAGGKEEKRKNSESSSQEAPSSQRRRISPLTAATASSSSMPLTRLDLSTRPNLGIQPISAFSAQISSPHLPGPLTLSLTGAFPLPSWMTAGISNLISRMTPPPTFYSLLPDTGLNALILDYLDERSRARLGRVSSEWASGISEASLSVTDLIVPSRITSDQLTTLLERYLPQEDASPYGALRALDLSQFQFPLMLEHIQLIGRFRRLESLSVRGLSRSLLDVFTEQLSNLAHLRNFRFTNFDLSESESVAVQGFFRVLGTRIELASLDLRNNQITALPSEIGNLTQLTSLNLMDNGLTAVAPEVGNLTHLTFLNLEHNSITSLPPETGNLINLTTLRLRGNELTILPVEIGNLVQLTSLDLAANQLTGLPSEIGNLIQLTSLDLAANGLIALPAEIGNFVQLTSLDLAVNRLTALPPEIWNLIRLTSLDLGNNQITSLPSEIGNLAQLTALHLEENRLTALPPEIGNLIRLTSLNLFDNRLTALPPEIENLIERQPGLRVFR